MANRIQDPTIDIVTRLLKTTFPAHNLQVSMRARRKDDGYNIDISSGVKGGFTEDVYQALAK